MQSAACAIITWDALVELLETILVRHGASAAVARVLAANCAGAERDGAKSHGVFRIAGYVAGLTGSWIDGRAQPQVIDAAPGAVRVEAMNGFAQPALAAAAPLLLSKARHGGIVIGTIRKCHHIGALWQDVESFAREGLVALAFVNSRKRIVPHGGRVPVYGTNPMAFAVPRNGDPIVFDQASSAMSYGDVRLAARQGETVPPGTGVDRDGNPTIDPKAIVNGGALLPFGGYKGAAIAMMTEIMAGALSFSPFSFEFEEAASAGRDTIGTGQTIVLIAPDFLGNGSVFRARIDTLVATLRNAGQARLPGDRRYEARRRSLAAGIEIGAAALGELRALAAGAPRPG